MAASAAKEAEVASNEGISGIKSDGLPPMTGEAEPREEKGEGILEMEKERDLKANERHPFLRRRTEHSIFYYLTKEKKMSFWANSAGAPSLWSVYFGDGHPRFLRDGPPPTPPPSWRDEKSGDVLIPRRLFASDGATVARFLETYYCGVGWRYVDVGRWIHRYLGDPSVVAIGFFCRSTELSATMFAVPLANGAGVIMSHGGNVGNMMIFEGLCVATKYRGCGLIHAALNYMDDLLHRILGTTVGLWCRDLDSQPFLSTAIQTAVYGFRLCEAPGSLTPLGTVALVAPKELPWGIFARLWERDAPSWLLSERSAGERGAIVAPMPENRRGTMRVFHYEAKEGLIICVGNTGRVSVPDALPIYEIMWCGFINPEGKLCVARKDQNFKHAADSVAVALGHGLLFGTDALNGGGLSATWKDWIFGHSGCVAWYMYNYVPPSYGLTRLHLLRDEL